MSLSSIHPSYPSDNLLEVSVKISQETVQKELINIIHLEFLDVLGLEETSKARQICEMIRQVVAPFLDRGAEELLVMGVARTASEAIRGFLMGNKSDPLNLQNDLQSSSFIRWLQVMPSQSQYFHFLLQKIQWSFHKRSFKEIIDMALDRMTHAMSDIEQATVIYDLTTIPHVKEALPLDWEISFSLRTLTQAFNRIFGDEVRRQLPSKSVLIYSRVFNDGIGDLVHLLNAEQQLVPYFGRSVQFIGIEKTEDALEMHSLHKEILIAAKSGIHLIDRMSAHLRDDVALMKRLGRVRFQVNISQDMNDPLVEKPKASIHEISVHDTPQYNFIPMGIRSGDAGIWFFDNPPSFEESLAKASEELQRKLGCDRLSEEERRHWYSESILSASMLYNSIEDQRAIFTALMIFQRQCSHLKRILFKTKTAFQGHEFNRHKLQQIGVERLFIDGILIFETEQKGLDLSLITCRLAEADWNIFKQLINGIIGVGGDNTFSEALSNPHTLPPLIFSQHGLKQNAYCCGILDLVKRLSDALPGKAGLIEYLETANKYAYWAEPLDYAWQMSQVVEKTGYADIRQAWGALVDYARRTMNLNEFILPWITEQLFFSQFPPMIDIRQNIMQREVPLDKKVQDYINSVRSIRNHKKHD